MEESEDNRLQTEDSRVKEKQKDIPMFIPIPREEVERLRAQRVKKE